MSKIQADIITNLADNGAPDFPNGLSTDGTNSFTYEEATVTLDNGITGTAKFVKVGNLVTMTGTSSWTHAPASAISSTAGIIPTAFRPSTNIWNVFIISGTVRRLTVRADGSMEIVHYDEAFVLSNQTDTVSPPHISYIIT